MKINKINQRNLDNVNNNRYLESYGNSDYKEINKNVLELKKQTKTPVLVGFGIKSKKDVLAISKNTKADGVIIGSALIQKYFDHKMNFTKYIISLRKFIKEVKI